jgi:hypothetical protein
MIAETVLLVQIGLTGLVLLRALTGKFLRRYPLFFSYLAFQLLMSIPVLLLYSQPGLYLKIYWYFQFISIALGYSVLWEMYGHILQQYPGALGVARFIVSVLLIGALAWALLEAFAADSHGLTRSLIAFERNVRSIQTLLLAFLAAVIWYYNIPIGRNLRGLIAGYSFFVVTSMVSLTLRSQLGSTFQNAWQYLQQSSYLIALTVWAIGFWNYCPNSIAIGSANMSADYDTMAERTYYALARAKTSFLRTFRQ